MLQRPELELAKNNKILEKAKLEFEHLFTEFILGKKTENVFTSRKFQTFHCSFLTKQHSCCTDMEELWSHTLKNKLGAVHRKEQTTQNRHNQPVIEN